MSLTYGGWEYLPLSTLVKELLGERQRAGTKTRVGLAIRHFSNERQADAFCINKFDIPLHGQCICLAFAQGRSFHSMLAGARHISERCE
jgi:hypothetical protein